MAIYFGNKKVSWNDTFPGGTPTPVPPEPPSPSVSYEEVCKEVGFCKNKLLELGGKGSYSGAWIGLRYSGIDYEDFTLGSSNVRAIRTSDGHFYTYENGGYTDDNYNVVVIPAEYSFGLPLFNESNKRYEDIGFINSASSKYNITVNNKSYTVYKFNTEISKFINSILPKNQLLDPTQ